MMTTPSAFYRVTRSGQKHPDGGEKLSLDLFAGGRKVWSQLISSGGPHRQVFRRYDDPASVPGSMEPLPEWEYTIGAEDWASGVQDDWSVVHNAGIGPLFIPVNPVHPIAGARGEFGFHVDWNSGTAPGSAGCPVFDNRARAVDFLGPFRSYRPRTVLVDHGLGYHSVGPKPEGPSRLKVFVNANGVKVYHRGEEVPATSLHLDLHSGKAGVKLNGEPVPIQALTLDLTYGGPA